MSLSYLIVQREVATIREVEEALARQVIYGGDLLTNLLEVARLDEGVLTAILAAEHGLDVGPTGEIPAPTEAARAIFPREMAIARSIAPIAIENDRLVDAEAERLPGEVTEQLAFTLGVAVEQRAALLVRVRQAITAAYGVPLERRMDRLVARLGGAPSSFTGSTPPLFEQIPPLAEAPRPPSSPPARARRARRPSAAAVRASMPSRLHHVGGVPCAGDVGSVAGRAAAPPAGRSGRSVTARAPSAAARRARLCAENPRRRAVAPRRRERAAAAPAA